MVLYSGNVQNQQLSDFIVPALELLHGYSREQVHAIFSPDTVFVPQAGTWGLHGIVDVPDRPGDYVFFVTQGQAQGNHLFDEGITQDGVLSWQSQPRQGFDDRRIKDFIHHREEVNNIYLFFRVDRRHRYTYYGRLKYLDHDPSRDRPVYFQWQLLDWVPTDPEFIPPVEKVSPIAVWPLLPTKRRNHVESQLVRTEAPELRKPGRLLVESGKAKRTRRPDYVANQAANQELGLLGETLVLRMEQARLISAGHPELAAKVRHVSVLENDTAGYDILSYDDDGIKVFVEVKTTRGSIDSDFFISASELAFARTHSAQYRLYRLYDYSDELDSANFYVLTGAPEDHEQLRLAPTNFKVSIRRQDE